MKLTLKIKLLPTDEQANLLLETIREANVACNAISDIAWQDKIFNQFKIHKRCYYGIKESYSLSSQVVVRCISKVADSYKVDRKVKRTFRELGGITYDSRILTYKLNDIASLWVIGGRINIPYVCHNRNYLPYVKGEADLVFKKGKFYLFQTVEIPDEEIEDVEEFIGCDFGLTTIVATSDGVNHSAEWLNTYREHRQKVRSSIQRKGTRSSRKLLKRLSGKERTTSNLVNHTISKSIVKSAKEQGKGIAIEDLTNIRFTSKRRNKKFMTKLGKWSFYDLRTKITYKCLLNGVGLIIVNPAYSSQTCYACNHIGKRTNKVFKCTNTNCNVDTIDADYNASKVISLLAGSINNPEKSTMFCSLHSLSGLKSARSLVGG